jgi:hypothetical protein
MCQDAGNVRAALPCGWNSQRMKRMGQGIRPACERNPRLTLQGELAQLLVEWRFG